MSAGVAPWWDAPLSAIVLKFRRDQTAGVGEHDLLASPALASLCGWVVTLFTWRAIFLTLFAYAIAMLMLCVRSLPETAAACTPPVRASTLVHDYVTVFGDRRFRLVALAIALGFAGLFLYVASVPAFLGRELGLPPTAYAVMFVPIVAGIVLGSLAPKARRPGRVNPVDTGRIFHRVGDRYCQHELPRRACCDRAWSVLRSILRLWHVARHAGPAAGRLDQFPQMRGLAASCQAFAMVLLAVW